MCLRPGCALSLAVIIGIFLVIIGKIWFLDRMVIVYEEMKDNNPEYGSWLY